MIKVNSIHKILREPFCLNASLMRLDKSSYSVESTEMEEINEYEVKKKLKAVAKIRFNWQNLNLYGPVLHPVKVQQQSVLPLNRKVDEKKKSATKKKMKYSRTPSVIADLPVLGNVKISKHKVDLLSSNSSSRNQSSLKGILDLFTSKKIYNSDFPFNNLNRYSPGSLQQNAVDILGLDDKETTDIQIPTIASILNVTSAMLNASQMQQWKLNLISEYGISNLYGYLEEMSRIEENLHLAIKKCFNGVPVSEIKVDQATAQYWDSIKGILLDLTDITVMQKKLSHPFLMYSGLIDYIGKYKDHPTLIEVLLPSVMTLPNSDCLQSIYQAVATLGIYNAIYEDNEVKNILLITVNKNQPANTFFMTTDSCEEVWKEWIAKLQNYWKMRRDHPMNNYVNITVK